MLHEVCDRRHVAGVVQAGIVLLSTWTSLPVESERVLLLLAHGAYRHSILRYARGLRLVLVMLKVVAGAFEMVGVAGVATSNRALLEVALEDVTAREGVLAELALVWPVAGVYHC